MTSNYKSKLFTSTSTMVQLNKITMTLQIINEYFLCFPNTYASKYMLEKLF